MTFVLLATWSLSVLLVGVDPVREVGAVIRNRAALDNKAIAVQGVLRLGLESTAVTGNQCVEEKNAVGKPWACALLVSISSRLPPREARAIAAKFQNLRKVAEDAGSAAAVKVALWGVLRSSPKFRPADGPEIEIGIGHLNGFAAALEVERIVDCPAVGPCPPKAPFRK